MRLWSLHPCYLDPKGLVALWREGLLGQAVLNGKTKGYRNHPQLNRFKSIDNPLGIFASYLSYIADEADQRSYNFNRKKIIADKIDCKIPVTEGQLEYEFEHLRNKLKTRDPYLYENFTIVKKITPHPLFKRIKGGIEDWEIVH
jgi:Pyrimidine dimer DNA glycosylase